MNSENRLKSILMNKKYLCFIVAFFSIILTVAIIAIIDQNRQTQEKQEAANKLAQQHADNYSFLCTEYNSAVDDYNSEVERITTLFVRLKQYNVFNSTPTLKKKTSLNSNTDDIDINTIDNLNKQKNDLIENTSILRKQYSELCISGYDIAYQRYSIISESYMELIKTTSIDYIDNMPNHTELIEKKTFNTDSTDFSFEDFVKEIKYLSEESNELTEYYSIANQITNPTENWIMNRLKNIPSITEKMAVTENNDPNNLLNKQGGYTSCIYFALKSIDSSSVPGNDLINKGTDAGGSIEVYPNIESAKNRCTYLSQFDNTLLYSGSYVIVGTMVIRTSYKLSNDEQIETTNEIIKSLTSISEST